MEARIISESRVDQGSDEDFKQGNCPAFSFVFVMLKKAKLAAAGTRKTLINIAS
jgi:hypothetical protein